jgi:hypothetical protein
MIRLKDIEEFETIPEILNDIITENIPKLEEHLLKGWDIDKIISISEYIDLSPLDCALIQGCFKSVKWLVEHGVNLNMKDNPSFLTAVRYCDEKIIQYIVSNGAKVNLTNNINSDAFMEAIYGENYKYLQLIHDLGHTVEKYGGKAFRNVVSDRNYDVLKFFISNGVDINYREADMVYPFKPTPLCVAARYVDLDMCKFLVENGADVTLPEKDGMRPYSIALEKGDIEMAEYFKSLEPVEYHSLQNKLDELKTFKLPKNVIDFLQGDKLHFELDDCDFRWIEFFSLIDTIPMKVGRQKLLRISKATGDYEHIDIVWNPKTKKIAFYDMEHKELKDITDFVDFIENTSSYMQKIIEGEL